MFVRKSTYRAAVAMRDLWQEHSGRYCREACGLRSSLRQIEAAVIERDAEIAYLRAARDEAITCRDNAVKAMEELHAEDAKTREELDAVVAKLEIRDRLATDLEFHVRNLAVLAGAAPDEMLCHVVAKTQRAINALKAQRNEAKAETAEYRAILDGAATIARNETPLDTLKRLVGEHDEQARRVEGLTAMLKNLNACGNREHDLKLEVERLNAKLADIGETVYR
jgi:hypothetical protein